MSCAEKIRLSISACTCILQYGGEADNRRYHPHCAGQVNSQYNHKANSVDCKHTYSFHHSYKACCFSFSASEREGSANNNKSDKKVKMHLDICCCLARRVR